MIHITVMESLLKSSFFRHVFQSEAFATAKEMAIGCRLAVYTGINH